MRDTLIDNLLKRLRKKAPQFGEIWWIKDAVSGVVHKSQNVTDHPALIVRGADSSLGEVLATVGSKNPNNKHGVAQLTIDPNDAKDVGPSFTSSRPLDYTTHFWLFLARSHAPNLFEIRAAVLSKRLRAWLTDNRPSRPVAIK